jgi:pimeloyl-ACP methyl ester carboxylesterase
MAPTPFEIRATDAQLDDLRTRLRMTRWPEEATVEGWEQGVPLDYMRELVAYWAETYDWRAREAMLNTLTQYRDEVEGQELHFVHMRSPHAGALPLLLSHGWPGSIVEFIKVIPMLLDPVAHGGDAADAFHIVAPSLPGFGYSGKPSAPGTGVQRMGELFDGLMRGLGYDRYVAQGGDWGAVITTCIGAQNRGACAAIHVNMPIARPTQEEVANPSEADKAGLAVTQAYQAHDSGYSKQMSTRPQTVAYGLADSPAGQAAWILEKFWKWTDCNGHPENVLSRDELLDNVMLYWLPGTAASSARIYWESFGKPLLDETGPVKVPTGVSVFPKEIFKPPRHWAERTYPEIVHWNVLERGGHFAAFEVPELFVAEITTHFRAFR